MPKVNAVKTALAHKPRIGLMLGIGLVLVVIAGGLAYYAWQKSQAYPVARVTSGSRTYTVQIAGTAAQQELGLGGRQRVAADGGMLFPYTDTAERCFWMKGMRVPIDMIWLDDHDTVVAVETNVSPASYPRTFCHDGRAVLELAANQAAASKIAVGAQLQLR